MENKVILDLDKPTGFDKNKDVLAQIEGIKKSILELRMSLFQGSGKVNTSNFKKFRREIARLKTLHNL